MNPYLQIDSLEKRFGDVTALNGINLTIERGAAVALLGPNGAGKSTLFGCLLGFIRPVGGSIRYNGSESLDDLRLRIGYMPERISLYPQNTVGKNALFFARLKRQSVNEVERQLKRVGLYHLQDRPAGKLSKGMLQRLGLAIALCGAPELLLFDEPFNGLDPALLETLQRILVEERERGATLLISTHTIFAVEPLATHAAILLEGNLAAHGSIEGLRSDYGPLPLEAIYHSVARHRTPEEVLA
jgi:ABC-type multidrug transport system ATPase subunit